MARKTKIDIEREQDAERQARRRERMRAEGRPLTHVVDRVILESLAFELARTPVQPDGLQAAAIPVGPLLRTAREILVSEGYDSVASSAAITSRLARRSEHDDPDHVPSLHPDSGVPLEERVRRRAQRDVFTAI